jgi:hypothetical protein
VSSRSHELDAWGSEGEIEIKRDDDDDDGVEEAHQYMVKKGKASSCGQFSTLFLSKLL